MLNLESEQRYILDVQAGNRIKLLKQDLSLSEEHNQIVHAARRANRILTNENYYLILKETQKFYPYRESINYQVEYANQFSWREYIHEGVLGLHQAIIRFNISRGVRLSSFAISWIRGSLSSLSKQQNKTSISKASITFEQAEEYNLTPNINQETISISYQELELIHKFVNKLNPIDRDIVNRCFGLNSYQKNSLIAIGRCNNLSPKQVARRRDKIIKNMRSLLDSEIKTEHNKSLLHCLDNDISLLAS